MASFVVGSHCSSPSDLLFSGCFLLSKRGKNLFRICQKYSFSCARCRRQINCCNASSSGRDSQMGHLASSSCFGKGTVVDVSRVSLTDFQKLGIQVDRNWRFLLPRRKSEVVLSTVIASMTFLIIGQPIVGVDNKLTWLVIGIVLGVWCLDNISWKGTVSNFCTGIFQNRQRVAVHEAGHFLIAYLLGVRVERYSIDAWTALRQGRASSGVLFNEEDVLKCLKYNASHIILIWLAGIAAEILVFGEAEGGVNDIEQVKLLLKPDQIQDIEQYLKRVLYQAMECIKRHFKAFTNLRDAMLRNDSLEKCCWEIEKNAKQ
jgi:hypothetical protein